MWALTCTYSMISFPSMLFSKLFLICNKSALPPPTASPSHADMLGTITLDLACPTAACLPSNHRLDKQRPAAGPIRNHATLGLNKHAQSIKQNRMIILRSAAEADLAHSALASRPLCMVAQGVDFKGTLFQKILTAFVDSRAETI